MYFLSVTFVLEGRGLGEKEEKEVDGVSIKILRERGWKRWKRKNGQRRNKHSERDIPPS
jgi:hypothetical protein